MKILHISAECYPAAKAGGLGDVVGALPKYLNHQGVEAAVIIPKYRTKWIEQQPWEVVMGGNVSLGYDRVYFSVQKLVTNATNDLGYPLFVVDIPGKYDREGVYIDDYTGYGYWDEVERAICFQQAVLQWVQGLSDRPDVLHCHDHHTGLIPFMVKHSYAYQNLAAIPTVFTIHNGEYSGAFQWNKIHLMPHFDTWKSGLLDWDGAINPLACAIKCAWKVTTVSGGYLKELQHSNDSLATLLRAEEGKSYGILNGIDTNVWNPASDTLLAYQLEKRVEEFKHKNKQAILQHYNLDADLPLITFIGRLVGEKGAHLLPDVIGGFVRAGGQATFAVLGTGDPHLHHVFSTMKQYLAGRFDVRLEYNERLAHLLYAGSDFLLMPSKVEPCGLNQMYALRYGTIPIVRAVGGLRDTITDIGAEDGTGIRFDHYNVNDAFTAVRRAAILYQNHPRTFEDIRARIMQVDFSWERSAMIYQHLYRQLAEE